MEDDKKVTKSELIRLLRLKASREYALAGFNPPTRSGISTPRKYSEYRRPVIPEHPLLGKPRYNHYPPVSVANPGGEAVARAAETPEERRQRLLLEHEYQRGEAKPWKKPWEK